MGIPDHVAFPTTMKQSDSSHSSPLQAGPLSRRHFLRSSAFAGIGVSTLGLSGLRAAPANSKLRVLSIGVIGTIGGDGESYKNGAFFHSLQPCILHGG